MEQVDASSEQLFPLFDVFELFDEQPPATVLEHFHKAHAGFVAGVTEDRHRWASLVMGLHYYPEDNAGGNPERVPQRAVDLLWAFAASDLLEDQLLAAGSLEGFWEYAPQEARKITAHLLLVPELRVHTATVTMLAGAIDEERITMQEVTALTGGASLLDLERARRSGQDPLP